MRSLGDILYNFHWVVPDEAARMAQPWAGGYRRFLAKRGIRAIINLRGRNDDLSWWKNETKAAAILSISHFDAMMDSRKLPTREMMMRLMEVFAAAPHPFVAKCSGGQDRTSLALALQHYGVLSKAFKKRLRDLLLERVPFHTFRNDFIFDNQMFVAALRYQCRTCEVTCPTSYEEDASSIPFKKALIYGLQCLKLSAEHFAWRVTSKLSGSR